MEELRNEEFLDGDGDYEEEYDYDGDPLMVGRTRFFGNRPQLYIAAKNNDLDRFLALFSDYERDSDDILKNRIIREEIIPIAIMHGNINIVKFFYTDERLRGIFDVNAQIYTDRSSFQQFKLIPEWKSYVDDTTRDRYYYSYGITALMLASAYGHYDVCEFLLTLPQGGANPNIADRDGRTALFYACEYDKIDIVRLLLKHDANINHISSYGQTPIFKCQNVQTMYELVHNGANLDIIDIYGDSLHSYYALYKTDKLFMALCQTYLPYEIINMTNEEGKTLLDAAHQPDTTIFDRTVKFHKDDEYIKSDETINFLMDNGAEFKFFQR